MMSDLPVLESLDRRLNVFSPALAESGLRGKVEAEQFLDGKPAQVRVAFTELRAKPDSSAPIDTQLMFGETVRVFDTANGYSLVKADRDRYVGWLEEGTISHKICEPTHLVCVPRTFFYPEPDLKLPHKGMRSMGSAVRVVDQVEKRGTRYALLETGEAVVERHVRLVGHHADDYVAVAEQLIHTPYLWAGTTAFGIDCSGFVKLAMLMCGKLVLRDSDMQAATLGDEIDPGKTYENLRRGDLVFWRGHVAIVRDENSLIHANGHTMNVAIEPLDEAFSRIEYLYERPIGCRRP